MASASPPASLRALGFQLKQRRTALKITLETAGKAADISGSSLSKAEAGKQALQPAVVEKLLRVYQMTDPVETEHLVELARQGRKRGWWTKYKDLMTVAYVGLETAATRISYLENNVVPGLLQTPAYFRALVLAEIPGVTEDELERRAVVRRERQEILTRPDEPCELLAVIDESVLLRPIGSASVMAEQLEHIIKVARRPNITVQVMPFEAGAHNSLTARFTILRFLDPQDPGTVFLEHLHWRDDFVESPEEVMRFVDAFDRARATAEPPARSLAMIEQARDTFRQQGKG